MWFIVARLTARFAGRIAGHIVKSAIKGGHSKVFIQGIGGLTIVGTGLYMMYSETIPYSQRRHLVYMSTQEEAELSEEAVKQILQREQSSILSENTEEVKTVTAVANNIIRVCRDDGVVAPHIDFKIHVIDSPVQNAFVLPNGSIFIYSGILSVAETEAGLAAVIGHEISHALARHSAEKIALFRLLILYYEFLRGFGEAWDQGSWRHVLLEFVAITVLQVGLPLAYSREMESEADRIGVLLVAKAGYDPRHAATIWKRMLALENSLEDKHTSKVSGEADADRAATTISLKTRMKELLSTHPCHERRIIDLETCGQEFLSEYE
ncbi:unnamed protein product, partial [Ectocarpus fasciculatus]